MQSTDLQVIKEIPGYKVILKAVLKSQIQYLVEQLVDQTGEESVILTASVSDGSLSHLGSDAGKVFLEDHDEIKSQFLEFCSKHHHKQKEQQEQQLDDPGGPMLMAPNPHGYRPVPNPRFAPSHVPTTTIQNLPHSQISPHSASPSSVHPVSLTRASPQSGQQGANVRHEPYPGARPKKTNFNSWSYKRLSQPSNSTSLPADPDDAMKDNQNPIIKTEPIDNHESAENSTGGSDSHSPAVQDAESESSSSTIINESSEVKYSDMIPSAGLGLDSDLSNHSGQMDSSISDNTVADPKKVKVEANTDLEAGQMTQPDNGVIPNIQTGMDHDTSTSGGAQGGVGEQSSQGYRSTADLQPTNKKLTCKFCHKDFSSATQIERHYKIHHGNNQFICGTCGKFMSSKANLIRHQLKHTGEKPFLCETCGKSYTEKSKLALHQIIHSGENYDSCNKSYKSSPGKVKQDPHQSMVTEKKIFNCETCGKSFQLKYKLKKHVRIHSGKKPYSCETCGKSFIEKGNLNRHQIVHTGEKPYSCNVCGKSLTEKSKLIRHLAIHTREQPFSCETCGKSFAHVDNLVRHMRTHNRDKV